MCVCVCGWLVRDEICDGKRMWLDGEKQIFIGAVEV